MASQRFQNTLSTLISVIQSRLALYLHLHHTFLQHTNTHILCFSDTETSSTDVSHSFPTLFRIFPSSSSYLYCPFPYSFHLVTPSDPYKSSGLRGLPIVAAVYNAPPMCSHSALVLLGPDIYGLYALTDWEVLRIGAVCSLCNSRHCHIVNSQCWRNKWTVHICLPTQTVWTLQRQKGQVLILFDFFFSLSNLVPNRVQIICRINLWIN